MYDIDAVVVPDLEYRMRKLKEEEDFAKSGSLEGEADRRPPTPQEITERQLQEADLSLSDVENMRTTEAPNGYNLCSKAQYSEYGLAKASEGGGVAGYGKTRESAYSLWPKGAFVPVKSGDKVLHTKPTYIQMTELKNQDMRTAVIRVWRKRDSLSGPIRALEDEHFIEYILG